MTTSPTVQAAASPRPPLYEQARRTFRRLRQMLVLAVGLTAVFWLAATIVLLAGHSTALSVRDRTAPAYLGALTAHAALSDADRSAWRSFRSGEAQLIGPGQRYRDDITTAGENLEHLAQLNTIGAHGQQLLKAVSGQLVTYQGLVEQADATYREGSRQLGYAYLTYASDVLHQPGGLLSRIDEFAAADRAALDRHLGSGWPTPWAAVVVAATAVVLGGFLVQGQVFTARTFRRTLNPLLLGAAVLLCGLTVWFLVTVLQSGDRFREAGHHALPRLVAGWQAQIRTADAASRALRADRTADLSGGLNVAATAADQQRLDSLLTGATDTGGLVFGLPVLALLIAGLGAGGIALRLNEFRG